MPFCTKFTSATNKQTTQKASPRKQKTPWLTKISTQLSKKNANDHGRNLKEHACDLGTSIRSHLGPDPQNQIGTWLQLISIMVWMPGHPYWLEPWEPGSPWKSVLEMELSLLSHLSVFVDFTPIFLDDPVEQNTGNREALSPAGAKQPGMTPTQSTTPALTGLSLLNQLLLRGWSLLNWVEGGWGADISCEGLSCGTENKNPEEGRASDHEPNRTIGGCGKNKTLLFAYLTSKVTLSEANRRLFIYYIRVGLVIPPGKTELSCHVLRTQS